MWWFYIFGIVSTAMSKLIYWMYGERPENVKFWRSFWNFWFGDKQAFITSIATWALFWVIGAVYIERFDLVYLRPLIGIPLHKGFAILLGAIAELGGSEIIRIMVQMFISFAEFFSKRKDN